MLGDLGEGLKQGFALDTVLSESQDNSMTKYLNKPVYKGGRNDHSHRAVLPAVDAIVYVQQNATAYL